LATRLGSTTIFTRATTQPFLFEEFLRKLVCAHHPNGNLLEYFFDLLYNFAAGIDERSPLGKEEFCWQL
jgi:hypothetical protein